MQYYTYVYNCNYPVIYDRLALKLSTATSMTVLEVWWRSCYEKRTVKNI
jgi:hypothetical protein